MSQSVTEHLKAETCGITTNIVRHFRHFWRRDASSKAHLAPNHLDDTTRYIDIQAIYRGFDTRSITSSVSAVHQACRRLGMLAVRRAGCKVVSAYCLHIPDSLVEVSCYSWTDDAESSMDFVVRRIPFRLWILCDRIGYWYGLYGNQVSYLYYFTGLHTPVGLRQPYCAWSGRPATVRVTQSRHDLFTGILHYSNIIWQVLLLWTVFY